MGVKTDDSGHFLVERKDRVGRQEQKKIQHFEDYNQVPKPSFKNVLAALKSKELKWFESLTGRQQKEVRKRLSRIYWGNMEKMVCAAKSGVLQEVLANQFKKTKQGAALVGGKRLPPFPVFL